MPPTALRTATPALLALAIACSQAATPQQCEGPEQCPSASRCAQKVCVADARPVAEVRGDTSAVARALARYDGSGSSDPDPGDAVASWSWSVRAVDAACEPPAIGADAPAIQVRFPCEGRFAVELIVHDQMGVASEASSWTVDVTPDLGPARVTVGQDLTVPHHCSGDPLRCTTDGDAASGVALAAEVTATDMVGTLRYRWTVAPPPGLSLGDGRAVEFLPAPDVAAPTAVIETDGSAIAGQWLFTVEALDDAGVFGAASQLVTVENAAPELTLDVPNPIPHRYDVSRRFLAAAEIPITVIDPDGDPIGARSVMGRHLGDGTGSVFEVKDLGDVLTVHVDVAYAAAGDELHLIGGAGLVREIDVSVADSNGATAARTVSIEIGNEPPVPSRTVATAKVGHWFDTGLRAYRATAALSTFVDPDGDPLVQMGATGDAACATISVGANGVATLDCTLPWAGSPGVGQFATTHLLSQRIGDPWTAATIPTSVSVSNRPPPTPTSTASSAAVTCTLDTTECCEYDFDTNRCILYALSSTAGTATLTPSAADPDGDPLQVTISSCGGSSPTTGTCLEGACTSFDVGVCAEPGSCSAIGEPSAIVNVTDGLASTSSVASLTRNCN